MKWKKLHCWGLNMWEWIKKYIFRIKKPKEPVSIGYGEAEPFKFVWGIIVPHTLKSGGASSRTHKINEYKFCLKMVLFMVRKVWYETRDIGGVYGAAERLSKKGVNASLELHKNAYNKKAYGFEVLYLDGDQTSKEEALKLVEEFKRVFPTHRIRRGNGLLPIKKGGRGYNNLKNAKKFFNVSLLVESFFIDNDNDWISPEEMASFWDDFLL